MPLNPMKVGYSMAFSLSMMLRDLETDKRECL